MIMASKKQALILLLALFFTISLTINSSEAVECAVSGGIAVYWGQHSPSQEGTLHDVCAAGNYQYVILEYLIVYDDGSTPQLNLDGHPTTNIEDDIKYCQNQNIKVFLNIGQDVETLSRRRSAVSSEEAAAKLADYLLENFLNNKEGPLGSVALDGIDFADVRDGTNLIWKEVVQAINASTTERRIYISAAPQCVYPDALLGDAINTGYVDYIWVEFFYNNPDCIYTTGDTTKLLGAWEKWTTKVPKSTIFMGLTADKGIAGYIPPDVLKSDVLPTIKKSSNYGGILVKNVYEDKLTDPTYSEEIKDSVPKECRCVCDDESVSSNFYGLYGRSLPL